MLEPEPAALPDRHRLAPVKDLIEEGLVELPRAMGIDLLERRADRRPSHTHVDQLAKGRGQAAADLAQRMGAVHLTEQHGDEMVPVAEALGRVFSSVLPTARAKSARSIKARICAVQLATATIRHFRLVGGMARERREWVVVTVPSYSQARGMFRTYFGQEWESPLLEA